MILLVRAGEDCLEDSEEDITGAALGRVGWVTEEEEEVEAVRGGAGSECRDGLDREESK